MVSKRYHSEGGSMKRETLLKAIECIMPGVDKAASPLGMDFLVFDKGWLRSFNDSVSVSFFAESPKPIHCAVKAQELYKVISKMEGDNLRMVVEESRLVIKNPKTTLKMTLMEEKQLGVLKERLASLDTDNLNWELLPKKFMDGLDLCIPGTKSDPTLGILSGVGFKENQILSTDNQRVSVYTMSGTIPNEFILPVEVVGDVVKYARDSDNVAITDSWIHFKNPSELIISTRRMIGEYPFDKIEKVIKDNSSSKKTKPYKFPEGLDKALDRVGILAEIGDRDTGFLPMVSLSKKGDFLFISGKKEAGEIEDKVEWKADAMPGELEIKIAPEFLKKILKVTHEFQIGTNKNCILFNSPNFKHLMVAKVEGE
jgi:DNA polymerase III sliding clamp (beta) subunit (PCNA family)